MRHEFESGEWVEYKPVAEMKHKHRTRLLKVTRSSLPLDADGELDKARIDGEHHGMAVYNLDYADLQLAALCALAVTSWSYQDVPVPQITEDGYGLLHADSVGETDIELADLLEPHLRRLTREPDPKETTSSSNGRSKAAPASLKG